MKKGKENKGKKSPGLVLNNQRFSFNCFRFLLTEKRGTASLKLCSGLYNSKNFMKLAKACSIIKGLFVHAA